MFQYIGMGEQAGSGYPKILRAWMEQHWQYPNVEEDRLYETTTLFMPMISLFPEDIQDALSEKYGGIYNSLDKDSRLALILAYVEGEVSNGRLSTIAALHSADATKILRKLVEKELLVPDGVGRGTKYILSNDSISLQHLDNSLQHKDDTLQHLPIAKEVRDSKRVAKDLVIKAILELCDHRYLTAVELAALLNRDVTTIRSHYLPQMLKDELLELKYEELSHRNQAYRRKGLQDDW